MALAQPRRGSRPRSTTTRPCKAAAMRATRDPGPRSAFFWALFAAFCRFGSSLVGSALLQLRCFGSWELCSSQRVCGCQEPFSHVFSWMVLLMAVGETRESSAVFVSSGSFTAEPATCQVDPDAEPQAKSSTLRTRLPNPQLLRRKPLT